MPDVSGWSVVLGAGVAVGVTTVGAFVNAWLHERGAKKDHERQLERDRLTQAAEGRRVVAEHEYADERAAIAVRQAIRDREHERARELAHPVMLAILRARQGLERDEPMPAQDDIERIVNTIIPQLQVERAADTLIEAIWELRRRNIAFRVALETQKQLVESGDTGGVVSHGASVEDRREALLPAIQEAHAACVAFVQQFARPVVDDPDRVRRLDRGASLTDPKGG